MANIEYILDEIERERRIIKLADFFSEIIKDGEKEIRCKAARIVSRHRPDSAILYYRRGWLGEEDIISVLRQFPSILNTLSIEETINLHSTYFKKNHDKKLLELIALERPDCFTNCYLKEISSNFWVHRMAAASTIKYLSDSDPNLLVELFEDGFASEDMCLRAGLASSLPYLLVIDADKAIKYYKRGINDSQSLVKDEVVNVLDALAPVDPILLAGIYDTLLDDKENDFVAQIVKQLAVIDSAIREQILSDLPEQKAEKLRELLKPKQPLTLKDFGITIKVEPSEKIKCIEELAEQNSQEFIKVYEEKLNTLFDDSSDILATGIIAQDEIRMPKELINYLIESSKDALQALSLFTRLAPEKSVKYYEKGLKSKDEYIRDNTAKALKNLAKALPIKTLEICRTAVKSENITVRNCAHEAQDLAWLSLITSAEENPPEFVGTYEKKFDILFNIGSDPLFVFFNDISETEAKLLSVFTRFAPDKAIKYYENGLKHWNSYIKQKTAEALADLAKVKPNKTLELCREAFRSEDKEVRSFAVEALDNLLASLNGQAWEYIEDDEHRFIKNYLRSGYIQSASGKRKSKNQVMTELIELITSPQKNYKRLSLVFEAGKAKDLAEIIACAEIDVNDYLVLGKLGAGAIKTAFLARNTNSSDEVVLLQINPKSKGFAHYENIYPHLKNKGKNEIMTKVYEAEFSALKLRDLVKLHKHGYIAITELPRTGYVGTEKFFFIPTLYKYNTTLEALLQKGALPQRQALIYFYQLCYALNNCHSVGIVHKDLKPDNIGIDSKGNFLLSDFGCTSMFSENANCRYQCPLELRPPELAYDEKYWIRIGKDWQSDLFTAEANVWTAGVILYRMLTGKRLFSLSENRAKIGSRRYYAQNKKIYKQIREFEKIRSVVLDEIWNTDCEVGTKDMADHCLRMNPEERKNALNYCLELMSRWWFIQESRDF